MKMNFLIFTLFFYSICSFAAPKLEESYNILDQNKKFLQIFKNSELVIDHVTKDGYELYGPKGLGLWLKHLGVKYLDQIQISSDIFAEYPTNDQIVLKLKALNETYPDISQLISIGKSASGRDLYFMKISNHPLIDQVKPEVKYISSMHGDEITGRELMVSLIEELLSKYGKDSRITNLIDNTEIYIMPSMNPDGSELHQRYNANGGDLNRNFPDFSTSDNQNIPANRQIETQAMMKFQGQHNFALSANFHGGAEVVNYPWDTIADPFPLNDLIIGISKNYADKVSYIKNSNAFPNGITNGFEWYEVNGGMQDWSYFWHGDLQLTIELSGSKWPSYSLIPGYYQSNKEALIHFLETVHQGAGFKIESNKASKSGTVRITQTNSGKDLGSFAFLNSEFYKVLEPGTYKFTIKTKDGFNYDFNTQVETDKIYSNGNYTTL